MQSKDTAMTRDERSASFDSARPKTAGAAQDAPPRVGGLDNCLILIPYDSHAMTAVTVTRLASDEIMMLPATRFGSVS